MAGGSGGCRAALVRLPLTPGLISSSSGMAGLPPFISFSISYAELPPIPTCMVREEGAVRLLWRAARPQAARMKVGEAFTRTRELQRTLGALTPAPVAPYPGPQRR